MKDIGKILGIIIVITLLISCGGGGGGGGGSSGGGSSETTAAPSLTGCWWTRTYQQSGSQLTEEWNFDNSTWTRKAFDASGTLLNEIAIPYTLSGNSILYNTPSRGWSCALDFNLTTITLTCTKNVENGIDVTPSSFPWVFTRK